MSNQTASGLAALPAETSGSAQASDVAELAGGPVTRPAATPTDRGRDRYIDSLRALALVRVVMFHVFNWWWLPMVFPSMGIMFALGGSLMAASLDRQTRHYTRVWFKRLKRLLPSVWALALVIVPIMFISGWQYTEDTGAPATWRTLWLWVFPAATPPSSSSGYDWVMPLWYISTYLWLVLLSPALLWLFRRWPNTMVSLALAGVLLHAAGLLQPEGLTGEVTLNVLTYAACWMVGFAHHDKTLQKVALWKVLVIGGTLAGVGAWWAFAFPSEEGGPVVSDIPLSAATYSLGVVLVLLRCYPDFSWVSRVPVLNRVITLMNRRALTLYVWGNLSIYTAGLLLNHWQCTARYADGRWGHLLLFGASWVVLGGCVLAVGWIEDLAAGRRIRLLPLDRV